MIEKMYVKLASFLEYIRWGKGLVTALKVLGAVK